MNHLLPQHIVLRPDTVDKEIWQETIEGNCYRLPNLFRHGDNVLDIGGHTGSFAWRAANSGARVVTVEPSRDNYHLLVHNLRPLWDRVTTINAAVWRSDKGHALLPFQACWVAANTGGGCTMGDADTSVLYHTHAIPLDDLLKLKDTWNLVKIDCEGAEFPILYTSKELRRIKKIVGEYHRRQTKNETNDAGPPYDMVDLEKYLNGEGFSVDVHPKGDGVGLFFASR